MTRPYTLLIAVLLVGCASATDGPLNVHDCNESFCGCQEEDIKTLLVKYVGEDSKPVWGVRLVCLDTGETLGRTDPRGLIRLKVKGLTSPGCGFQPECEAAYFVSKGQGIERPFWFGQLLREGNEIESNGRKAVVVDITN